MKEKHPQNLTGTAANQKEIAGKQHQGEKGEKRAHLSKGIENSLLLALQRHKQQERASFHTPGHKGRLASIFPAESNLTDSALDLTELPGLDALSHPQGILAATAAAAACLYGAGTSFLSVNGASAAIAAAILAASPRGDSILVPRNAHRSVLDAICLTGLTPIWYQPTWNSDWALWDESTADALASALDQALGQDSKTGAPPRQVALAVVVSPTYGGALSDIKALAKSMHARGIPLLVDEAHGAHQIEGSGFASGALACGADLVAQSMHKTLTGLTQTGLLHVGKNSLIGAGAAAEAMQRLTSTSPNYLLMASIDETIRYLSTTAGTEHLFRLCGLKAELEARLSARGYRIYRTAFGTTETHLLVGYGNDSPSLLYDFLVERGVFPEAILGRGVLFMLGLGTQEADLLLLLELLCQYASLREKEPGSPGAFDKVSLPDFMIAMSLQEAIMSAKTTALDKQALNRVSAQFLAPCPPGIPLLIPGQVITEEVLASSEEKQFIVVA